MSTIVNKTRYLAEEHMPLAERVPGLVMLYVAGGGSISVKHCFTLGATGEGFSGARAIYVDF